MKDSAAREWLPESTTLDRLEIYSLAARGILLGLIVLLGISFIGV